MASSAPPSRVSLLVILSIGFFVGWLAPALGSSQPNPRAAVEAIPAAATSLACLSSGSGASYIDFCLSKHGNVRSIKAPSGNTIKGSTLEGYELCDVVGPHGYDAGSGGASGFGASTISEPGGANTLPLTITRTTNDGEYRLVQSFGFDAAERDLTVTMTVKNLTSSSVAGVRVVRYFEANIDGDASDDVYDDSVDSVWGHDAEGIYSGHGLNLSALTYDVTHQSYVSASSDLTIRLNTCTVASTSGPTAPGDFGGVLFYDIGSIGAGAAKTVKIEYRVF